MAQDDNDTIPHQDLVEAVIEDMIDGEVIAESTAITDAVVAHALNSTFSDTEVEAALNALGVKINLIIAALEVHNIVAT